MKFALLDPRPIQAAQEANEKIFALGPVFGIEVTVPALAERCIANIDPQHSDGDASRAAIEATLTLVDFYNQGRPCCGGGWDTYGCSECDGAQSPPPVPDKNSILVTVRADLDSVGTMAIFSLRSRNEWPLWISPTGEVMWNFPPDGKSYDHAVYDRVMMVATADKFARGGWPGRRPLPSRENPWPEEAASAESTRELAAIVAAVMDFRVPLADRVATMERWLLTGEEPEQYREQVERERIDMITALETGAIQTNVALAPCRYCGSYNNYGYPLCPDCGKPQSGLEIAVVESTHRAATLVGYTLAPVVVALNPAFRLGSGEPHQKFTVCQFTADYVDLRAALTELAALESGWGGSPTIIGSPQGTSSKLTVRDVLTIVGHHLK